MRKKYYANDNAFSGTLDEYKTYWLGFLAADGCILKDHRIQLKLKKSDINHIKKFKLFLDYDGVIENNKCQLGKKIRHKGLRKYYETSMVRVSSKQICSDLKRYEIIRRKSLILKFPSNIPNDLLRHYIRGYIDGDGCWNSDHKKYPTMTLTILSTKNFLKSINEILFEKKIVYGLNKIKKPSKIHALCFGGNKQIKRIAKWLYYESNIYLNRKKEYLINHDIIDEHGVPIEKIIDRKGEKNSNAKNYLLESPGGTQYIICGRLKNFCHNHDLCYCSILDVRFGRKKHHKGWTCNLIT